ncbi:MAG TPA: hypothetical protein VH088_13690 [Terriglobales bacterium]|jgi:hypothetical protein|nr:hypothetical protein [Terriglobales bacterium]
MPDALLNSTKTVKHDTAVISWEEVSRAFAPFAGSCLYAIRADTFFHLALRANSPARFVLKNLLYPMALAARSKGTGIERRPSRTGSFLFVCDYPAEAGFGSLRPLLRTCPAAATVVVNSAVFAARHRELGDIPGASVLHADTLPDPDWSGSWRRAQGDYRALLAGSSSRLRRLLKASRLVIWALLFRAYRYRNFLEALLANAGPAAVITHNDFTSLSYLAGDAARRTGVPDFTLQHGFPSPEYFPTTATHYLVWGSAAAEYMKQHSPDGPTAYIPVGAPRLDSLASLHERHDEAKNRLQQLGLRRPGQLNVLFLSQSHSPLFSPLEHKWVFSVIAALAGERNLHLMIRRHPQERSSHFRQQPGLAHAAIVPASLSLIESVLGSDVVISVNSTAMLEAALLRTPVVQICASRFGDRIGMLRFPNPVANVESAKETLQELSDPGRRALWLAEQQAMIETYFGQPGMATQRAWTYIQQISGDSRRLTASAGA